MRMRMKRGAVIAASALVLAACSQLSTPVNDPASPEAPCGMLGVVCSGTYPNALCCTANLEECGGPDPTTGLQTCPTGYCCSINQPEPNPNVKTHHHRTMRPQFRWSGKRR